MTTSAVIAPTTSGSALHSATTPTLTTKWGRLGKIPTNPPRHLINTRAILLGFGGKGKSYLTQGCEDALIFNFDGAPVHNQNVKAHVTPIRTENNVLEDADGTPVIADWEFFRRKIDLLIDMAKAQEPRPKLVVFDTLDSAARLTREYAAKKYGKESVQDAGRAGWALAYDEVASAFNDLSDAGYGVWLIGRLSYLELSNADGKTTCIVPALQQTVKFYSRFEPLVDLIGVVYAVDYIRSEKVEQPYVLDGVKKSRLVEQNVSARRFMFATSAPADFAGPSNFANYLKARGGNSAALQNVELSANDAWGDLDRAFQLAMTAKPK